MLFWRGGCHSSSVCQYEGRAVYLFPVLMRVVTVLISAPVPRARAGAYRTHGEHCPLISSFFHCFAGSGNWHLIGGGQQRYASYGNPLGHSGYRLFALAKSPLRHRIPAGLRARTARPNALGRGTYPAVAYSVTAARQTAVLRGVLPGSNLTGHCMAMLQFGTPLPAVSPGLISFLLW